MTYNKKTIEDIDVAGKRVLVRCDFNVPLKDGVITSDKRIVGALPTIQYLLAHHAKVIPWPLVCRSCSVKRWNWLPTRLAQTPRPRWPL